MFKKFWLFKLELFLIGCIQFTHRIFHKSNFLRTKPKNSIWTLTVRFSWKVRTCTVHYKTVIIKKTFYHYKRPGAVLVKPGCLNSSFQQNNHPRSVISPKVGTWSWVTGRLILVMVNSGLVNCGQVLVMTGQFIFFFFFSFWIGLSYSTKI